MKYRIVVLSLIVAAIGGFGWYNARRLSEVRAKQRIARTEAGRLEIPAGQSDMMTRKSQPRRNPAPAAKLLTPDDIAFMNDLETARQNPGTVVPKVRERHAAMADRFKAMTPAQVRKFVAEVRAHEDLAMEVRQRLVQLAVGTLLNEDPANGVDLYIQSMDLLPQQYDNPQVGRGIVKWAETDPAAALAWVRANLAEHSDLINNEARCAVIGGTALSDRKLAFRLIAELGIDPPANATQGIVGTAKTNEERNAALTDLREYVKTINNEGDRIRACDYAIAVIGKNLAKEGFQTAVDWVASAGLTDSEMASFGSDLSRFIKDGERGKWVDWLAEKLAAGKYQRPIRKIMMSWASGDLEAAALWLNTAPAGPVKNYAIGVFAVEVANSQPAAAVQWATTLPAGRERDDVMDKIYHNWPTNDPAGKAAAAAFEKEYHIQHHH